MNLTSMLVLTTIFIDVSNNLPKTSYMKMIDVWLLFNLIIPFLVVLIHTYMDTLRKSDDDDDSHEFLSRHEMEQRRQKAKRLNFLQRVSLVYNPLIALLFVSVYWITGLNHAGLI